MFNNTSQKIKLFAYIYFFGNLINQGYRDCLLYTSKNIANIVITSKLKFFLRDGMELI